MKHLINRCALAVATSALLCSCSVLTDHAQNTEEATATASAEPLLIPSEQNYLEAEQFVHGYLYDAMLQVWAQDRLSWNQLLSVHACSGENQEEKLSLSYEKAQPLFSQTMVSAADSIEFFTTDNEQAVLSDVAQLAYRLFSASYAHGYARQIKRANELDPGIQEELCGVSEGGIKGDRTLEVINYPTIAQWKLSSIEGAENTEMGAQHEISLHAEKGYTAFSQLLRQQYEKFDALVFSHAYQNTDAYEQLFFEVNRYENVQSYNQNVTAGKTLSSDSEETPHADFAYLVLASGYHWGTLSVLAMLEEQYPRLHTKAKDIATQHIEKVTSQLSAQQTTKANDSADS